MRKPTAAGAPPEELAKALMRREIKPSERPRSSLYRRYKAVATYQWRHQEEEPSPGSPSGRSDPQHPESEG